MTSVQRDNDELEQARQRWRAGVAKVLARGSGKEPSEFGAAPEERLNTATYEGVAIHPLYTALDERPELPLPGAWPYTRGADAGRDVLAGWKVADVYPVPGQEPAAAVDLAAANATVLAELGLGISALVLRVGDDGVTGADLDRLLEGVFIELAPVRLQPGESFGRHYAGAAEALAALAAGVQPEYRGNVAIDLGADPLTAALTGAQSPCLDEVVAVASAAPDGVRAITIDGAGLHDRGADAGWELAAAIAAAVDTLRALTAAGLSTPDALGQISFRIAVNDDQFAGIAKLRALRQLWARVAQVLDAPEAGAARIHAVGSLAMMSQRDPWVNMLRSTLAGFAAGLGGADTVQLRPFDAAIVGGMPGQNPSFARRIARNTQLLLLEESHLGRVLDPAAGSWFVEELTEQFAEVAWERFRDIEDRGGFLAAVDHIAEHIDAVAARREADIAHRRTSLTGVNEFPNLIEAPLPNTGEPPGVSRYAAGFEALRDRSDAFLADQGSRPTVLLLPLGPLSEHNIRATFATNLLASGGIEAINLGQVEALGVAEVVSQAREDGLAGDIAVICGADKRYAVEAAEVVAAAHDAGIAQVFLAGPERAVADAEVKPDGYLTMKIDAVEALSAMLTRLGA